MDDADGGCLLMGDAEYPQFIMAMAAGAVLTEVPLEVSLVSINVRLRPSVEPLLAFFSR